MRMKTRYALAFAGIFGSSMAMADVNLSAQHQLVSSVDVNNGSQAVFDITINNTGSDNLSSLVFTTSDSNMTFDVSAPVFEITDLVSGGQTTLRVTFNAPVGNQYFDAQSLILLNAQGYNHLGEKINASLVVDGGAQ